MEKKPFHFMGYLEHLFIERKVIDAHVHVFPPRLFDAIWRFFEANYWPINYRLYGDEIDFSPDVFSKIFYRNAKKLYKLKF